MGDVVRISKGTTKQDEFIDYVEVLDYYKERVKDYDEDGVMVWNGKRCETEYFSKDVPQYLKLVEMLKEYE